MELAFSEIWGFVGTNYAVLQPPRGEDRSRARWRAPRGIRGEEKPAVVTQQSALGEANEGSHEVDEVESAVKGEPREAAPLKHLVSLLRRSLLPGFFSQLSYF